MADGEDQQQQQGSGGMGRWYPLDTPPLVFHTFSGVDTQASRPAIKDDMCSIIDGFFPEGPSNLRTLPGIGAGIYTSSGSLTISFFKFANIGSTPYCIVFLSDGSIVAVNTSTYATTTVAPAHTITDSTANNVGITQWGGTYIVIVANQTNGFWVWDGTRLFTSGTLGPDVVLTNSGASYTSQPTVSAFGGAGSSATFSVTLQNQFVQTATVVVPGSGYSVTDSPVLVFRGGGCPGRTAKVVLTVVGASVTGATIVDGGAGYTNGAYLEVRGGGGVGATLTATITSGSVAAVSVTTAGNGYSSTTPPILYVTDVNNPVAQGTLDIMPFGIAGTAAETYSARLWVAKESLIQFTAPNSVVNFNSSAGGGAFKSTDSFLQAKFTGLKQTNGTLFLVGDSSMNYISGVNTSSGTSISPPVTTFTNQNSDPEVGTSWPSTVDVFDRSVIFANPYGVHSGYGGALTKVSAALDGLWASITNFAGFTPSSAKAVIFGKKVYMVLLPVVDQISGQKINKLLIFSGKTWFTSQQDVDLSYIASQDFNATLVAYGTDRNTIWPLFQLPSANFVKTVRSKLWDRPGYMFNKATGRLWGLTAYYSALSPELTISIDSEATSASYVITPQINALTWVNAHGTLTWTNAAGGMVWYTSGLGAAVIPPTPVGQQGVLVGLTMQTSAADMSLLSLAIDAANESYRG